MGGRRISGARRSKDGGAIVFNELITRAIASSFFFLLFLLYATCVFCVWVQRRSSRISNETSPETADDYFSPARPSLPYTAPQHNPPSPISSAINPKYEESSLIYEGVGRKKEMRDSGVFIDPRRLRLLYTSAKQPIWDCPSSIHLVCKTHGIRQLLSSKLCGTGGEGDKCHCQLTAIVFNSTANKFL